MLIFSDESESWELVWPSRGEGPDRAEVQMLRDSNRNMFVDPGRLNVISPWSFSYNNRLRKED